MYFIYPPSCLPFILHILSFQLMGYKKGNLFVIQSQRSTVTKSQSNMLVLNGRDLTT